MIKSKTWRSPPFSFKNGEELLKAYYIVEKDDSQKKWVVYQVDLNSMDEPGDRTIRYSDTTKIKAINWATMQFVQIIKKYLD